ncbi:hypothetical protein QZH41_012682 [Actinostola sp. cb2023]|nr:hypothetical protein QZH41_012682 [Actinostola sp. cb2023]
MVLQDCLLMSKGSLAAQAPKPPGFEEILSDLRKSNSQDVAFQHPSEVCPAVKGLKGHAVPLHGDKDHTRSESQTSYLPTQNTGITTGDDLNRGQDKEKYSQVTDFIKNYSSLVESSSALKDCGDDLETQRRELGNRMEQVRAAWKTIHD